MKKISRRRFLQSTAAAAAVAVAAKPNAASTTASPTTSPYRFMNAAEVGFIEAAVARLIPKDEIGAGALEAGVPQFIDLQLAGAWGAGERFYRNGPWQTGTPSQGYQLPYVPAELFRNAIRAIDTDIKKLSGKSFTQLSTGEQDRYLEGLQKGSDKDLDGIPAKVFFDSLLAMTVEGFFSDPVYGGNRDMVAWRMIGFPGAYANYYDLVDRHGMAFTRAPMSLAQDAHGRIQLHPDISSLPKGTGAKQPSAK